MTYNSNMERAAVGTGSAKLSRKVLKPGSLAWASALISILVCIFALGIAVFGVVTSGDFRSFLSHQTLTPFITAGFAIVGALVASRRPKNPIGWIFVGVGLLYALTALAAALFVYGSLASPLYPWTIWLGSWLWIPGVFIPVTIVMLIFPDGQLPSPRWRFVAWSAVLGLAAIVLVVMLHPGPVWGQPKNPFGVPEAAPLLDLLLNLGLVLFAVGFLGSIAGLFVRFRRSAGIEREQIKWLVYAVGMILLASVASSVAWIFWPDFPSKQEISITLSNLGILGIAVAAAIAILRYRLYDIDLIINRTLVYSALTIGVAALYGLVVGALGTLFQSSNNLWLSLLATGLVAVAFQPLRDRLQRAVNRFMYGERDDPYQVLSKLGQRLQATLTPDAVLSSVVETIAQALKLPYVGIALYQGEELRLAADYGLKPSAYRTLTKEVEGLSIPLVYQFEKIGELILTPPSNDPAFSSRDKRLLEDIARQVGVAAHAVRLTQDLQHSRELLVKSREEERRRLRRDLHDGIGPQLASLKLNLDVARMLVSRDPRAAETLLLDIRSQTQAAIADIRQLVHDLRPPALDEFGLRGAIQEYARRLESQDGLSIQVDAPVNLSPLPAAVEVAAYRITLEALANVVRHSQGRNCRVSISLIDKNLQVEIRDDGLGLPAEIRPGVGLNSMRERAAELGGTCQIEALPPGGTHVLARLPLV